MADALRLSAQRDRLWHHLSAAIPGIVRHTPGGEILPHNLSVGIPGIDGDALLVRLRDSELCVSSGAACSSSNREPSHVLTAIGVPTLSPDPVCGSALVVRRQRRKST